MGRVPALHLDLVFAILVSGSSLCRIRTSVERSREADGKRTGLMRKPEFIGTKGSWDWGGERAGC